MVKETGTRTSESRKIDKKTDTSITRKIIQLDDQDVVEIDFKFGGDRADDSKRRFKTVTKP